MINENSKEYKFWKEMHGLSYFEKLGDIRLLYKNDSNGHKWRIDNIALKDTGLVHYLSWTETNGETTLIIFEIAPQWNRRLHWKISPAKSNCYAWLNKWTEEGLYIIYNDSMTNFALKVTFVKKPRGLTIQTTELAEMIHIKKNWTIGFKFYTAQMVSTFDLKSFRYTGELTEEEATRLNIIPTEQWDIDEELE